MVKRGDRIDERRITLILTRAGEAMLRKLSALHRAELRRMALLPKPLVAQLQD